MPLPDDLKAAYENFTMLALQHGYIYAAVMIGLKPKPSVNIIGNVTERGHDLATLLRKHADLIDEKENSGQVEPTPPIPSNAN
jgi:hypothetical protein